MISDTGVSLTKRPFFFQRHHSYIMVNTEIVLIEESYAWINSFIS